MVYLLSAALWPLLVTAITARVLPYKHPNPGEDYNSLEYFECPDDNWVLGKFDDVVYCYRPYKYNDAKGGAKTIRIIQDNYCKNVKEGAYIGNVHSPEEVTFLKNEFLSGVPERRDYVNTTKLIVGMYKTSGTEWNILNFAPVDEKSLTYLHLQEEQENTGNSVLLDLEKEVFKYVFINNAIEKENASFLCKIKATRRPVFQPIKSNKNVGVDLQKYTCGNDSQKWEIANLCGEIHCYNWVDDESAGVFKNHPVEFNECGEKFAGANMVSIHCKAEDDFIRRYGPNIIGLYRPHYENQAKTKDLRWQDGSVKNYVNLETKQNFDLYYHYPNALVQQQGNGSFGWKLAEKDQKAIRVCKRKAGLTNEDVFDEDWIPVPTKKVNNQECADLGRKATTTQCPDNTWVKKQLGDETYCYRVFDYDYSREKEYLDHTVCKEFHESAKAASMESLEEEDYFEERFYNTRLGLFKSEDGKDYVWADGTNFKPIIGPKIYGDQKHPLLIGYINRRHFSENTAYAQNQDCGLCKMKALTVNECPEPIDNSIKKLADYTCSEGWIKFKACNQVNCYRNITLDKEKQRAASQIIADNMCSSELGEYYSNTHLASIHCEREDRFIRNTFGKVLLPLRYTGDDKSDPSWEWDDESDFNYIPADDFGFDDFVKTSGQPKVYKKTTYVDKIVTTSVHGAMHWNIEDDGILEDTKIVCKKPATLKKKKD